MYTKLTLNIKEETVKKAKSYSRKKGVSVSKLVEEYLNHLEDPSPRIPKISIAHQLAGIAGPVSRNYNWKKEYRKALSEKHGL
jgi:hypothetical protein